MFSVPGWNLAAKSLVQEQARPVKTKDQGLSTESGARNSTGALSGSTKRKRDQAHQKQGPKPPNKPQGPSSNDNSSTKAAQKHKRQRVGATSEGSNSTHDETRKRAKNSRKSRNTDQVTGANTEPVSTAAVQRRRPPQSQIGEDRNAGYRKEKHYKKNSTRHEVETREDAAESASTSEGVISLPPIPLPANNLTPLQAKMRAKLTSARFRHLNETLYTTSSADALDLFTKSPGLFAEYHEGFSLQVRNSWPQNPVNLYTKTIGSRGILPAPAAGTAFLPRRKSGICTIADLGCGDAPLARNLHESTRKLKLRLLNFDLHAPNELVTKADISALPLRDGEVDVAVFCLSLMGTNWLSFIEEAWRVLRGDGKGELWVAEVKSRFGRRSARKGPGRVVENSVGKRRKPQNARPESDRAVDKDDNITLVEDERDLSQPGANDDTDLEPFIEAFQRRGFMVQQASTDKSNKMFVSMVFTKTGVPRSGKWKNMKFNGQEYQQMEERKPRFQSGQRGPVIDIVDDEDEGKLLKPCVYKLR